MPRFNPYSAPSRGDKQAQATALDLQQQQLDQSQQDHMLGNILQFYGIGQSHAMDAAHLQQMQAQTGIEQLRLQQEQQMTPEKIRALGLENESRQIANRRAGTQADWDPYNMGLQSREHEQTLSQQGQLFPEHLQGLQLANQSAQTHNDWDPYNLGMQSRINEQNLAHQSQLFPGQLQGQGLANEGARVANASAQIHQDWTPYQLDLNSRQNEQALSQNAAMAPGQLAGQGIANAGAAQQVDQQHQLFPGQLALQGLQGQRAQTEQDWLPYNLGLQSRQGEQNLDQQGQMFLGQKEQQGLSNTHLGLENTAQSQSNDWAPWLNQARYDATKSMADEHSAKTGLSMKDAITLRQMGVINDEDLISSLPPQMQATHAQRQQDQRNSNWPKVVSDAAANGITGHEDNIMQNYGPENLSYLQDLHKRSFVPTSVEPHDPTGVNNWLLNLLPAKRQKPKL